MPTTTHTWEGSKRKNCSSAASAAPGCDTHHHRTVPDQSTRYAYPMRRLCMRILWQNTCSQPDTGVKSDSVHGKEAPDAQTARYMGCQRSVCASGGHWRTNPSDTGSRGSDGQGWARIGRDGQAHSSKIHVGGEPASGRAHQVAGPTSVAGVLASNRT